MIVENEQNSRQLNTDSINCDLTVVGGGLSGTVTAIAAAREGLRVTLVQDRPVLGGNASSEVRLWILGATSHMGNNNRWAREGGIVDEILVENTYRNPEGNPVILDTILLDKVNNEENIKLLLNTSAYNVKMKDVSIIESISAFCSQNSTNYEIISPLFCDSSGDGIVAFLAGASYRMGAEDKEEFNEKFAPDKDYGELLGHSIYFYSRETDKPVKYIPPDFAMDRNELKEIPKYRELNTSDHGCKLWWIEYGGRIDTVYSSEEIKWELWRIVYGLWDYIKNSGEYENTENLTLEWVGTVPGKRESRRFIGDYILNQRDIVNQNEFEDAVSFGGWAIDVHPADGLWSKNPGCTQYHPKGVYQIPLRCLYSKDVKNLFLGGRIISVSHVAFSSTRVMATCGANGQAIGISAALCTEMQIIPADIQKQNLLIELQKRLIRTGQYIPNINVKDKLDHINSAKLKASSVLQLKKLEKTNTHITLDEKRAILLPVEKGKMPNIKLYANVNKHTQLTYQLRTSTKTSNFTPDEIIEEHQLNLSQGDDQTLDLDFSSEINSNSYVFICLLPNPNIHIYFSDNRITGLLTLNNIMNGRVSTFNKQQPVGDIGIDSFEFWIPNRRPKGKNYAMEISSGINCFYVENIKNNIDRPTVNPNAWVADLKDKEPRLDIIWNNKQKIKKIVLSFDTDFDNPMESVLMGHPERTMPFCVQNYKLLDGSGKILFEKNNNYQTRNIIEFRDAIITDKLTLCVEHPSDNVPAALFSVRCYE